MSDKPPQGVSHRAAIACEADVHGAVMLAYSVMTQASAPPALAAEAATVVSELAMNIVKYAACGGHVCLRVGHDKVGGAFLEITAEDRGPGIVDLKQALQDHYSSGGTLGVGLPGVKRMVDEFQITSTPGVCTRVRVKKWLASPPALAARSVPLAPLAAFAPPSLAGLPPAPISTILQGGKVQDSHTLLVSHLYASVNRPCFGEAVSGDRPFMRPFRGGVLVGLLDVLGHGAEAHTLALHCDRWILAMSQVSVPAHFPVVPSAQEAADAVETLLQALHTDIKGSRGTAISLAWVTHNQVAVAGVGNTMVYVVQDKITLISAQPGILGGNMPRLRPLVLALSEGDVLLLTTDGISERVDSRRLLSLKHLPVQRIAADVLQVYGKTYDDASCAVFRHTCAAPSGSRPGAMPLLEPVL